LGHFPPPTSQTVPGGAPESLFAPEIYAKPNYQFFSFY